jgi:hypothetical protein
MREPDPRKQFVVRREWATRAPCDLLIRWAPVNGSPSPTASWPRGFRFEVEPTKS